MNRLWYHRQLWQEEKDHSKHQKKSYCNSVDTNQSFYIFGSDFIHRLLSIFPLFFVSTLRATIFYVLFSIPFVCLRFAFLVLIHDYSLWYAYRYDSDWVSERMNEGKRAKREHKRSFYMLILCAFFICYYYGNHSITTIIFSWWYSKVVRRFLTIDLLFLLAY